ncbi:MAG TPA: hypothetical protein VD947_04340 [Patescibacteria group bacterium]|nr:hypothetical protein [Patescibacteria group bacterium]
MVKYLVDKIRPGKGFAHTFHISFVAFIPIVIWGLVKLELVGVAVAVLLLSKWRMFAIHPRHWINHVRTNAVDIIVGLSILEFITESNTALFQGVWVLVYEVWLLAIKPKSTNAYVAVQALIAQTLGIIAMFLAFEEASMAVYVVLAWAVCYFATRHFLAIFEEKHGGLISALWAFLASSLVWVLSHWLLFFGPIAQPAIIISVISFGLAGLYYLDQQDRLATNIQRQILFAMFAVIFVIVVFSDWGDKAV